MFAPRSHVTTVEAKAVRTLSMFRTASIRSNDVFNLLEKGAKTLVCGDAKRMAPAVRKTFAKIISEHRGFNEQQAAAEVRNMEQELFTYVTEAFT